LSAFKIINSTISFSTNGEIEFVDLTNQICDVVANSSVKNGLVHIFAPHATGVILLTENDPALIQDIQRFFEKIVPKSLSYHHPSNAYAHLRSILFPPDRTIPVIDGKVIFGTWQSLFFVETDVQPRRRKIIIQVMGEI
jgi:secondary thiamine-phosphate synthase enzyme